MNTTQKTLYIIFADLKGYGSNAGNNDLLAKVTDFFFSLNDKYFADGKEYFFKPIGDGILATGHSLIDMAEKALLLRDEIKNYQWASLGFPKAMNVRIALHTGEAFEHYAPDGRIREVSGTAVIQAARLEPYTMVGEVFCSEMYAELLRQQYKTHNFATASLGTHNLGKVHDKFEMAIALLFREANQEMYEEYKTTKAKKHLEETIASKEVEVSAVAQQYMPQSGNVDGNTTPENQATQALSDLDKLKEELLELTDMGEYQQVFDKIKKSTVQYNKPLFYRLQKQIGFAVNMDLIDQLKVFIGSLN